MRRKVELTFDITYPYVEESGASVKSGLLDTLWFSGYQSSEGLPSQKPLTRNRRRPRNSVGET